MAIISISPGPLFGQKKSPSLSPPPAEPAARSLNLPGEVNDERVEEYLDVSARKLMESGRTVRMSELIQQLNRRSCSVTLPKLPTNRPSSAEMVARFRTGVLVIGDPKRGRDLQMVFKHCLPSQYVLQLIQ